MAEVLAPSWFCSLLSPCFPLVLFFAVPQQSKNFAVLQQKTQLPPKKSLSAFAAKEGIVTFAIMKSDAPQPRNPLWKEKIPSMQRRCPGNDYTARRMYMITMVTEDRRPLFGKVLGRSDAPAGSPDAPRMELSPLLIQVQCSRRLTDEQIEEVASSYLSQARMGAVLVSPCISKGEKHVMRTAFEEGLPLIILQENGFTELAKPGGRRMEACMRGQLLLLAPWAHHNEQITISRNQCLLLKEMARQLCERG